MTGAADRVCALCGASLQGRRSDAIFCSPSHRAEGSRLSRLLRSETVDGYSSVMERLEAIQKRTNGLPRPGMRRQTEEH